MLVSYFYKPHKDDEKQFYKKYRYHPVYRTDFAEHNIQNNVNRPSHTSFRFGPNSEICK